MPPILLLVFFYIFLFDFCPLLVYIILEVVKMQAKIKVSIPKSVLETLKADCQNFNVLKSDNTPNFNAFINTLIMNYYETFTANDERLHDEIAKIVEILPERYQDHVSHSIIKTISKREQTTIEGNSIAFSFKPTKQSEKAVTLIQNVLLSNESLSSFYRRLFVSYVSHPQPQRELIICKENYELLLKAIKKGVQVCISTQTNCIKSASVYAVAPAKDELYNYVLSVSDNALITLRLAKIISVSLLSKKAAIEDDVKEIFNRQIRCGSQYPISKKENSLIKVVLSQKGLHLFQKIYLYRPVPVKIEGNIYYFDCSINQATYYFKRFGVDAIITEPANATLIMANYYAGAARKYSKAAAQHTIPKQKNNKHV